MIKESLKAAKKEITVHKVHGTQYNFDTVLDKQRPGAIHFSGHGLTAAQIRQQNRDHSGVTFLSQEAIDKIYQRGPALVLED